MYKSLLTIAIALISFTLPAIAMQSKDLPTNQNGSYLNISITEQMDVKEDLLISSHSTPQLLLELKSNHNVFS